MAFNKTLLSDQHVVLSQHTGPGPKNKGEIVTTIKVQNLRTSMIKTIYVVQGYKNVPKWREIISYPEHGFVITNIRDLDLNNINADSDVQIIERITQDEAREIARITAEINSKKAPTQPAVEEAKPKKTNKPGVDFDLFKKNFTFGE